MTVAEELLQMVASLESQLAAKERECRRYREALQNIMKRCEILTDDYKQLGAWTIARTALQETKGGA